MTIHHDYLSQFTVKGNVVNSSSSAPLEDVEVNFVDTGLDYKRSKLKPSYRIKIGRSNNEGKIEINFNYFWGFTEGFFSKKPKGDFQLELIKENYMIKTLDYNRADLKRENDRYIINIGTVTLSPSAKSSKS